jgi:uncharacterized protein (TIGR02145 family)
MKKHFFNLGIVLSVFSLIFYECTEVPIDENSLIHNGYNCKTVIIGTQEWFAENLQTSIYNDGIAISNITDSTTWAKMTSGAYCFYENNAAINQSTYGALYNWYAVDTKKLCPAGWHVPTDADWTVLVTYLGGESVAGGKMKEAGTAHWVSPNTGATNTSNFSALPGGFRSNGYNDGAFGSVGIVGNWWSSTQGNRAGGWGRHLYHLSAGVSRNNFDKSLGFSVRCLRD